VHGHTKEKPIKMNNTWDGVRFTSDEIHKIAQNNNFNIVDERGQYERYYWFTLEKPVEN